MPPSWCLLAFPHHHNKVVLIPTVPLCAGDNSDRVGDINQPIESFEIGVIDLSLVHSVAVFAFL